MISPKAEVLQRTNGGLGTTGVGRDLPETAVSTQTVVSQGFDRRGI